MATVVPPRRPAEPLKWKSVAGGRKPNVPIEKLLPKAGLEGRFVKSNRGEAARLKDQGQPRLKKTRCFCRECLVRRAQAPGRVAEPARIKKGQVDFFSVIAKPVKKFPQGTFLND